MLKSSCRSFKESSWMNHKIFFGTTIIMIFEYVANLNEDNNQASIEPHNHRPEVLAGC